MEESEERQPTEEIEEPTSEEAEKIDEVTSSTTIPEKQTPTLFRNILRWTLTLLIVFGLGFLTSYFLFFRPAQEELNHTNAQLEHTKQEMNSLENRVADLSQENEKLELELNIVELRLLLLGTISDLRAANLAIADDDYAGAILSIQDASQTMRELRSKLSENQREILNTMQTDLAEVEDVLTNNPETAQSRLERLTMNLLRLERTLLR